MAAWGLSTAKLRERLRAHGRALGSRAGAGRDDHGEDYGHQVPPSHATRELVKREARREGNGCWEEEERTNRAVDTQTWLGDAGSSTDDGDELRTLKHMTVSARDGGAPRSIASPSENATRTVAAAAAAGAAAAAASAWCAAQHFAAKETMAQATQTQSPAVDEETARLQGAAVRRADADAGCLAQVTQTERDASDKQTQTRWKADVERQEAKEKREHSLKELREREVALQAEVQRHKLLAQRACRTRDDAIRRQKETTQQLEQAQQDLTQARRDHVACLCQRQDGEKEREERAAAGEFPDGHTCCGAPDGFEAPSMSGKWATTLMPVPVSQRQGAAGKQSKGWQVLQAERERRQTELRAEKAEKELEEQRARGEVQCVCMYLSLSLSLSLSLLLARTRSICICIISCSLSPSPSPFLPVHMYVCIRKVRAHVWRVASQTFSARVAPHVRACTTNMQRRSSASAQSASPLPHQCACVQMLCSRGYVGQALERTLQTMQRDSARVGRLNATLQHHVRLPCMSCRM